MDLLHMVFRFLAFVLLLTCPSLAHQPNDPHNIFYPLQLDYYKYSCPNAEKIIQQTVKKIVSSDPGSAPELLRLHFHDCFVRGCDGSILLNSSANIKVERDSGPNLNLQGFDRIDEIKAKLEKACPGVVSCADILSLAARDAVGILGGPSWVVPTGRKDGRISKKSEADALIPTQDMDFSALLSLFKSQGLDKTDLVALSGAHTIGDAHCSSIEDRLYNYKATGKMDPGMDPIYGAKLRKLCKRGDITTKVSMDPFTELKFDNKFYTAVETRRGLFHSDQELLTDPQAKAMVDADASSPKFPFFDQFSHSMTKLSLLKVLTSSKGEVRKDCKFVN